MAQIQVGPSNLTVHLSLREKLMSFHGSVEVPLLHVEKAEPYQGDLPKVEHIYRFWGTYVPGEVAIGSESVDPDHDVFYDVRDPKKAVAIRLTGDTYKRMIVQVDDTSPETMAAFINERAEAARRLAEESHRVQAELSQN